MFIGILFCHSFQAMYLSACIPKNTFSNVQDESI